MIIDEKQIKEAQDWVKIQLEEISPEQSGIMIFTYGTEDFVVSVNAAKKVMAGIKDGTMKKFPKLLVLMIPFWVKADTIKDLEEFMGKDST